MKPSAIYSKSGKGVQEASGKTSLLKRADRAVLSAIDGRATLGEVAQKVGKSFDAEFEKLIAQLDKEGFVREVAAGASSTSSSQSRPAVAAVKPGAKAPAAKASSSSGGVDDLDFTTIMPAIKSAPRPLAPAAAPSKAQVSDAALRAKEQESALYKARQEAEAKAQAERDRLKQEAEAKARAEAEAKARLDAENRLREEAIARTKAAAEAQVKAARAKAEAEAQAKLEAERKVREEVERKVREEAERALREAEALRQRLEEERKAREDVERKRREEEERRRKEEEERRAREEAERKAREEAERKRREEEERKRREEEEKKRRAEEERRLEEEARRLREEIEAKAREAAERARREEEDRLLREKEEQVRRAREAEEARMLQARAMEEARMRARQRERDQDDNRGRKSKDETKVAQPTLPAAAAAAAPGGGSLDALMADLDSFSQREEEERQAREVADRQGREEDKRNAQAEAERRAQEDAERQMREQLEREAREQEERQRRDEEERRAREEAERRAREAEEQRLLEAERKRKAQEALLAKAAPLPDIEVSDKDLDLDEVRRDEAAVARDARKAQREREREARKRAREAKEHARAAAREEPVKYAKLRRKVNWERPLGITLLTLLVAGLVALHIIPLPMDEYERAASEALGRPVKIGTGRLSLYSGLRLDLDNVSIGGSTTIASARAYPQLRALIDGRQVLGRLELAGVRVPQSAIGAVVGAKPGGEGFRGARIFAKDVRLTGPVALPPLEAEAVIGPDGAMRSVLLSGPDSLSAKLTPAANGEIEFDVTAASIAIPFAPELTLSTFAMRGTANRQGMNIASWGGGLLDGAVSGTANVRWSGAWHLEGGLTARAINAAVLAPALLSEGKAEGHGRFSMSGNDPMKLYNAAHLEGNFSVGKGVLGTIDLSRVLHTSGRQYGGRTQFTEMTGHAIYDRGAVALRNVNISAGALTAGASADIAPSGAIAGRIVADIRTTVQPLRAILVIGGTVKEPQVRN